ncbi:MAG: response regulator [Saprospiraceae bacterium]|nr:response regulator [Saprospiraceae bacterium]
MNDRIILVIDDEHDVSWLFNQKFRKQIKDRSLQFCYAESAEEALQILIEKQPNINLVFTDLNMPGMTGFEFLRKLNQNSYIQNITTYVMSAYSDPENMNMAKDLGAAGFITKPLDFDYIKAILFQTDKPD